MMTVPTTVPKFTPDPNVTTWRPPPLSAEESAVVDALRVRTKDLVADALSETAIPQGASKVGDADGKTKSRTAVDLEEFCGSTDCLARYARAAKWDLAEAERKLANTLKWRASYKPAEIRPEEVEPEATTGKNYLNGFDKKNHPTIYLKPGRENTKTYDRQVRFTVFNLETATRYFKDTAAQKIVLIIDFEGWTPRTAPSISTSKEIIGILSHHYPERLAAAYLVNAPWMFSGFFKIVSPFIDPITRNKVRFVDMKRLAKVPPPPSYNSPPDDKVEEGDELETETDAWVDVRRHFQPDYLEHPYGGTFQFTYDHAVYWKHLVDFRAQVENATVLVQTS